MSFIHWQRDNMAALIAAGFTENAMQEDWVGGLPQKKFKDIRNTRDTIAEEKARLCLLLGERINKCPASVVNGSVQLVHQWQVDRLAAAKIAGNKRSSIPELEGALNKMEKWK